MGGSSSKSDGDPVEKIIRKASRDQLLRCVHDLPFSKGHRILREFADALEAEYAFHRGPIVGQFLDTLDETGLSSTGVSVQDFIEWTQWCEALIKVSYIQRRNYITIAQLRAQWGLTQAEPPAYAPAPAAYPAAYAPAPAAYPGAQAYPQAQAYPSQGYPTQGQQPTPYAVAVATAAPASMPVARPVASPVGGGLPVARPAASSAGGGLPVATGYPVYP